MVRKSPRLIPFLEEGLKFKKYRNLNYKDISKSIFSIHFPHKTRRLPSEDEQIFKDWYALNGRKYLASKNYTEAKQAMLSSLKKSDYVEKVLVSDNILIYRILTAEEVIEKKKLNDIIKREKKELNFSNIPSVDSAYSNGVESPSSSAVESPSSSAVESPSSSGVGSPSSSGVGSPSSSGVGSPSSSGMESNSEDLNNESTVKLMHAIKHDHAFGYVLQGNYSVRETPLFNHSVDPMFYSGSIGLPSDPPMDVDYTISANYFEDPQFLNQDYSSEVNMPHDLNVKIADDICIADNIPVQEQLNDHDLQDFGNISTEGFEMENSFSDKNILSFDDIHPLDFDPTELFGTIPTNPDVDNTSESVVRKNPDVDNTNETVVRKNLYHCKQFGYMGKWLGLFCEAQISGVYDAANVGEMQIVFNEAALTEIQGAKLIKCISIKDDLLIIFEPKYQ